MVCNTEHHPGKRDGPQAGTCSAASFLLHCPHTSGQETGLICDPFILMSHQVTCFIDSASKNLPCLFPPLLSGCRFSHEILQDLSEMQVCSKCFSGFPGPPRQSPHPFIELKRSLCKFPFISICSPIFHLLLHIPRLGLSDALALPR